MTFRPANDPVLQMERLYEKLNACETAIAHYEAAGMPYCAKLERRRLAGLKAARTRMIRTFPTH